MQVTTHYMKLAGESVNENGTPVSSLIGTAKEATELATNAMYGIPMMKRRTDGGRMAGITPQCTSVSKRLYPNVATAGG